MKTKTGGLFLVPRPVQGAPKMETAGVPTELPDEQKAILAALVADLTTEHQPNGPSEMAMIQTMAAARWRANYTIQLHAQAEKCLEWEKLLGLERYQVANEKSFRLALKTLKTLQRSHPRPKLVK